MVQQGIIIKQTEPTPWVSSLTYPKKANGKLRICLDPKDLNKAIIHENHKAPTLALVQEDFTSYHWNYNGHDKHEEQEISNAESNLESNAVEENDDDLPESTDQTIDWAELYDTIDTFTTFEQL